jgi:hypothetical protein
MSLVEILMDKLSPFLSDVSKKKKEKTSGV